MTSDAPVKKSCCTWPRVVFALVLIAITGVLMWLFIPFDRAIGSRLPHLGNSTGSKAPAVPTAPPPTPSPTLKPYTFIQCQTVDDCCQGLDGICDLRINEILLAGAHNSFSSLDNGFFIEPNQDFETKVSLEAGYRDIAIDMCNCDGVYVLCHGYCKIAELSPIGLLNDVLAFLVANPSEIIVINMEINSAAGQEVTLDGIYDVLKSVSGLTDILYQQNNTNSEWPTLRTLRNGGTRIILFHYGGEDCDTGNCPMGMNYYFDHSVDTRYSFSDLAEIRNITYSCPINRGSDRSSKKFFAVNSFITPTSRSSAAIINSENFTKIRIDDCSSENEDLTVTTYYVDFGSLGDVPRFAQERNAALAQRRRYRGSSFT
jgi:hypothetical protein